MKKIIPNPAKPAPQNRTFSICARFTPNGPDLLDRMSFIEFRHEAYSYSLKIRAKEQAQREKRFKELVKAKRRTEPVIKKFLSDKLSPDAAARRIKRLIPNKRVAREVLDHWSHIVSVKLEDKAGQKERLAREEADIHRRGVLLKANRIIHDNIEVLCQAATGGDADAAKLLAEVAILATDLLHSVGDSQSELPREIARWQTKWPVFAFDEPGWQRRAEKQIQELDLGAELRIFRTRFRQARGADENHPARVWAKAVVRVVEETRLRMIAFSKIARDFGSSEALTDFVMETGWEYGRIAKWAEKLAELPIFSRQSLPSWKAIVRQIIREDLPDFHTAAEWANQRNTMEMNGRATVGEIRNAILDDIVSALSRLAPEEVCRSSAAEIQQIK